MVLYNFSFCIKVPILPPAIIPAGLLYTCSTPARTPTFIDIQKSSLACTHTPHRKVRILRHSFNLQKTHSSQSIIKKNHSSGLNLVLYLGLHWIYISLTVKTPNQTRQPPPSSRHYNIAAQPQQRHTYQLPPAHSVTLNLLVCSTLNCVCCSIAT